MDDLVDVRTIQLNSGSIVITWPDGHRSIFSPRELRLRCPCAQCVDEMTGAVKLEANSVPVEIEPVDSISVGNYAVQFLWSDTHYTGIYTHKFLRTLCPCEICEAAIGNDLSVS